MPRIKPIMFEACMPVFPLQSSPGSCPVWRSGFSRSFHTNSQESKRVNGLPEIFIPDSASLIVLHIYCKYKSIGVTANGTFFFYFGQPCILSRKKNTQWYILNLFVLNIIYIANILNTSQKFKHYHFFLRRQPFPST